MIHTGVKDVDDIINDYINQLNITEKYNRVLKELDEKYIVINIETYNRGDNVNIRYLNYEDNDIIVSYKDIQLQYLINCFEEFSIEEIILLSLKKIYNYNVFRISRGVDFINRRRIPDEEIPELVLCNVDIYATMNVIHKDSGINLYELMAKYYSCVGLRTDNIIDTDEEDIEY